MIFFKQKPPVLFDDLASDEIKGVRVAINAAADRALIAAAKQAVLGNEKTASERIDTSRKLRWLAISLTIDMLEAKIDLKGVDL